MEGRLLEKKVSSSIIYEGRVVTLRVDQVVTQSGRMTSREVVDRRDTVSVLPLDDMGRVLLVRQFRYAVGVSTLEIPAGSVDAGETPSQAAHRELREETGFDCHSLTELLTYYPAMGYSTERMTVYLAKDLAPAPLRGDEEDIHVDRKPFDEVYDGVATGDSTFLDAKSNLAVMLVRSRGLA